MILHISHHSKNIIFCKPFQKFTVIFYCFIFHYEFIVSCIKVGFIIPYLIYPFSLCKIIDILYSFCFGLALGLSNLDSSLMLTYSGSSLLI